jgi:hypothetical protein
LHSIPFLTTTQTKHNYTYGQMDHPELSTPNLTNSNNADAVGDPAQVQAPQQQAQLEEDSLDGGSCWRDMSSIASFTPRAKRAILNRHRPGEFTLDFYRSRANAKQVEAWLRKQGDNITVLFLGYSKQGKSTFINCLFTAKDSQRGMLEHK